MDELSCDAACLTVHELWSSTVRGIVTWPTTPLSVGSGCSVRPLPMVMPAPYLQQASRAAGRQAGRQAGRPGASTAALAVTIVLPCRRRARACVCVCVCARVCVCERERKGPSTHCDSCAGRRARVNTWVGTRVLTATCAAPATGPGWGGGGGGGGGREGWGGGARTTQPSRWIRPPWRR